MGCWISLTSSLVWRNHSSWSESDLSWHNIWERKRWALLFPPLCELHKVGTLTSFRIKSHLSWCTWFPDLQPIFDFWVGYQTLQVVLQWCTHNQDTALVWVWRICINNLEVWEHMHFAKNILSLCPCSVTELNGQWYNPAIVICFTGKHSRINPNNFHRNRCQKLVSC